nr:hypothetical protein [uncultured Roseateles sp.]
MKPEDASAWAMALVEELAEPPYEIIEVALGKGLATTLENLAAVQGERDSSLAGRWLLGYLRQSLPDSDEHLHWAIRRAMQIARIAALGDETYYGFDSIDDELFLARNNTYGSVADCRRVLVESLQEYPMPPVTSEA